MVVGGQFLDGIVYKMFFESDTTFDRNHISQVGCIQSIVPDKSHLSYRGNLLDHEDHDHTTSVTRRLGIHLDIGKLAKTVNLLDIPSNEGPGNGLADFGFDVIENGGGIDPLVTLDFDPTDQSALVLGKEG